MIFQRYVALGDTFTQGVGDPDDSRPSDKHEAKVLDLWRQRVRVDAERVRAFPAPSPKRPDLAPI